MAVDTCSNQICSNQNHLLRTIIDLESMEYDGDNVDANEILKTGELDLRKAT